ncbi:MAG: DUF2309 domain-containing protein, partial [Myxococcota bacterium]|nr:DUF2309 domain-containing protein [Myxococcota bacterium]
MSDTSGSPDDARGSRRAVLDAVSRAAHLLPAQGPIGRFIHHNTLHAFQHLAFHDALAAAHDLHDAEVYLSEERYRQAWREGRIEDADVEHALGLRGRPAPDAPIGQLEVREIEWLALRFGIAAESPAGLRWRQDELGEHRALAADIPKESRARIVDRTRVWLGSIAPDAAAAVDEMLAPLESLDAIRADCAAAPESVAARVLWGVCRSLAPTRPDRESTALLARVGITRTHRDLLIALGAPDPAERSNTILIDFLGAYLDRGMARWPMPHRERGLLACFRGHFGAAPRMLPPWVRAALDRLGRAAASGSDAVDLVASILDELGVAAEHWDSYVPRLLLQLPGWTGMVARLESNPGDRDVSAPPVSLVELTAMRLALDVESMRASAAVIGHHGPLAQLRETAQRAWAREERRRAHDAPYRLARLCQLAGVSAGDLIELGARRASEILDVLDRFDGPARRRTLHEAYERHFARDVLAAVCSNRERPAHPEDAHARFQVMFCFDDREESLRRAFEHLDPRHATYGVAGFYGIAMAYRGLDTGGSMPLCPAVVTPAHTIREHVVAEHGARAERRRRVRALAAWLRSEVGDGSRSFVRGAALTPILGLLAAIPLAASLLFPRAAARLVA